MEVSLYCCYSIDVRNYLSKNGLRYKIVAENPNSHKIFWAYVRDKMLDKLLSERLPLCVFYACATAQDVT